MCEIKAYMSVAGSEDLIMDDVAVVRQEDGEVVLTDILGQQKRVAGVISEVRVMEHKLFVKQPGADR